MAIRTIKANNLKWINIDDFDKSAAAFLKKNFHFHSFDINDCFDDNFHPKIDSYDNYLFIIVNFPDYDTETKKVVANELDVFIGKDFLITIQKKRFRALKNCFYRCAKNNKVQENFFSKSTAFLFYKILEELFSSSSAILKNIRREISKLEDSLFAEETNKKLLMELSTLRRNILNFRSIIDPQRFTMNALVHSQNQIFPKEAAIYFDDIHDRIEEAWVILNNYLEITSNFQAMNESIISNKTNEVIKVLTVISVALLPLTLLSGIYGMNIEGLPWTGKGSVVAGLFLAVLAVIIATLLILKRKKWL